MIAIVWMYFLLYGIKYFIYKKNDGKVFAKIFDFFLSIATVGLYIFFTLIFAVVYGMGRANTKIAVLLTIISFFMLVLKCLFIKKESMKYTIAADVFYFIILMAFILVG